MDAHPASGSDPATANTTNGATRANLACLHISKHLVPPGGPACSGIGVARCTPSGAVCTVAPRMSAAADSAPSAPTARAARSALGVLASVTRLHIVAVAALGTLTIGWCFTGAHLWRLTGICALDWLLASVWGAVSDLPEDHANGVAGTEVVARHPGAIRAAVFAAFFGSLVTVHLATPRITVIRLGFYALALLYSAPLLPGHVRVKQLYVLKNVAAGVAFLLTCVAYPVAGANEDLARGIGVASVSVTALALFLLALAYELMRDLRDAPGDEEAGVLTYPVIHGADTRAPDAAEAVARVGRLVGALAFSAAATLVLGFLTRVVPWRIAILSIGPIAMALVYRRWLARGSDSADCVRLAWMGAGLLAAYQVWVALGLPGARG